MCLIALALDQHARFPLVIAANRDEFLQRPAAALDWWQATPEAAPLLGGRDLLAGGTWLGLNAQGRIAMLTNVRDPARLRPTAPSRGAIVPAWLATDATAGEFWCGTARKAHNPFNLLAGDASKHHWWWADDRAAAPRALAAGLYGLSNAALDTPWPKVQRVKAALAEALDIATSADHLQILLFDALADRSVAPDEALPDTGIGLVRERALAPAFIRTPDARYGTRCSTLVIVERQAGALSTRVVERQFDAHGNADAQRGVELDHWPLAGPQRPPVRVQAVSTA